MEEARPKWLRSTKGAPFTGIGPLEADILAIVWEKDEPPFATSTRRCASAAPSPTRPS